MEKDIDKILASETKSSLAQWLKKHRSKNMKNKKETMSMQEKTVFELVKSYSKEQLISLLKEIRKIGENDAPKEVAKSNDMKAMFRASNLELVLPLFYETYSKVTNAIEVEILHRIIINKF